MVNKTALSILISIILTIIIVSLANVGTSLFLSEPEYSDFCDYSKPYNVGENFTKEQCEAENGIWFERDSYCDLYTKCNEDYQKAREPFHQKRFYIFAFLGFFLLIFGLFVKENLLQITSLASGGILVFQSIVFNLENKLAVFLTLLGILVVFGILAWRVIKRYK
jgi:hypothetical protein